MSPTDPLRLVTPLVLAFACAAAPNPKRPAAPPGAPPELPPPATIAEASAADGSPREGTGTAERSPGGGDAPVPPQEAAAEDAAGPVIARVGQEQVRVRELLSRWMHQDSAQLRDLLEQVVLSRLVALEARRLEIRLPRELVEGAYAEAVAKLAAAVRERAPDRTLEQWIAGRLGLDPERYLARVRSDVVRELLAERVVRAFVLSHERARVRAIVTRDRRTAERALERARGGESFADLARELSEDPSKDFGGLLPPVLRNDTALSRLAFLTGAGGLGGPIEQEGSWLVVSVEALDPPEPGTWPEIAERVEASLAREPVQDPEYWQWKAEMQERYRVDLSPFLEFIGEAPPEAADAGSVGAGASGTIPGER